MSPAIVNQPPEEKARQRYLAETFGTFMLVFAGTGAIVVNDVTGGAVTHVGVSLTFGLVVTALIYTLGDISGCHLNPAVTIGLWVARRFEGRSVVPYILCQLTGAVLASLVILLLFGNHAALGASLPAGEAWQSCLLEFLLTLFLMLVVLHATTGSREKVALAGIAIGSTIALEALFAGPICGASMNPARSFGPAIVSQHLEHLGIYLLSPVAGACAAVFLCRGMGDNTCCRSCQPSTGASS